jgi:hypothetical protein
MMLIGADTEREREGDGFQSTKAEYVGVCSNHDDNPRDREGGE